MRFLLKFANGFQLFRRRPSCGKHMGYVFLARLYAGVQDSADEVQQLVVIQPEYKTGPVAKPYVPAQYKLEEAVSLVEAIRGWEVYQKRIEAVRELNSQYFFGRGKMAQLKTEIWNLKKISGVFINTPTLTRNQHKNLEDTFRTKVYDRFGIVLHIFKERAHSKEAKLQVELAENPYLYSRLFEGDEEGRGGGRSEGSGNGGETSMEARKFAMKRRRKVVEDELKEIREKRKMLREHRAKRSSMPTVAVVGYTNAGKTTLIKALSQDSSMVPKDILFATLDSTLHAGKLPCGLGVLYIDTIGFISDIPVELVESFASTLEDSIAADVLVHVIDGSHPRAYAQRVDVMKVLEGLELRPELLDNMVNVVNKSDKILQGTYATEKEDLLVSSVEGTGLAELEGKIQAEVLRATKQSFWEIELPVSGPQLSWLYGSDASINSVTTVEGSSDRLMVNALLSEATLNKFVAKFTGNQVIMTPCSTII